MHHLPSAPKVLPRLKRLLQDGNSSLYEVVQLIRLDAAIAARVLQVGNSAYYNKGERCQAVEEAVSRVGYNQVYELVSLAVASQVLIRPLEAYEIEADEIWRQSVACALAAELIARLSGDDYDVAYTVGLLHRVGMVVISEWALRHWPQLRLVGGSFPAEYVGSERENLGFTHAEVGAELLQGWDFSQEMTAPVRWQYAPHGTATSFRMATILGVARWVRARVCNEPRVGDEPDATMAAPLHLSRYKLAGVVEEVRVRLDAINTLLDEKEPPRGDFRAAFPAAQARPRGRAVPQPVA